MPSGNIDSYFALELFCGSGNLTIAMKHFLPNSCGVDCKTKGRKLKVIPLDLSTSAAQTLVTQWCCDSNCIWVHFGVPCGTASRARLRRTSRRAHGPPPLRAPKFPDGLPGLKPSLQLRVSKANALYQFMSRLILDLDRLGTTWTVENPWTSFFGQRHTGNGCPGCPFRTASFIIACLVVNG